MSKNYEDMKEAVEALSNGENTVIFDDAGMPSIMVVVPVVTLRELGFDEDEIHPAFIVNGEVKYKAYFSKFINVIRNNRAYSLPLQVPQTNISFEKAVEVCKNKGPGWRLLPDSLWSAVSMMAMRNKWPHGNTYFGHWYDSPEEEGTGCAIEYGEGKTTMTLTGSGPETWGHNGSALGIQDMVGNVMKFTDGVRLVRGEIQVIPDADCIGDDCSWKAITPTGDFVEPGSFGTIHYINYNGKAMLSLRAPDASGSFFKCDYRDILIDPEMDLPSYLKHVGLFWSGNHSWYRNSSIALDLSVDAGVCTRGGFYANGPEAGLFSTTFGRRRDLPDPNVGFYSVYYE